MRKSHYILLASFLFIQTAGAEWEVWVVPKSRTVKPGKELEFSFGVSGGGDQTLKDFKACLYGEDDSKLGCVEKKPLGEDFQMFFFEAEAKHSFVNMFQLSLDNTRNLLAVEGARTPFPAMYVTPNSSGKKMVKILVSYKEGNIWKTISTDFHYTATTWTERNSNWLNILFAIGVLSGLWNRPLFKWKRKLGQKTRSLCKRLQDLRT